MGDLIGSINFRINANPILRRGLEWGSFFVGLIWAIWAATQNEAAAQSILIVLSMVIAINFGLPTWRGGISLHSIPLIAGILILGFEPALILGGVAILLAQLARPIWRPLWQPLDWENERWYERMAFAVNHLAAAAVAVKFYERTDGLLPIPVNENYLPLAPLLWMGVAYVGVLFIGAACIWLLLRRSIFDFGRDAAINLLANNILAFPFGVFTAIIFADAGMPAFVLNLIGLAAFSALVGLFWQRNFVMQRQLSQLATLNRANIAVRESLDLLAVLRHTHQQITNLLPADRFFIALRQEDGGWEQPFSVLNGEIVNLIDESYRPDDFTKWVVDRSQILDLDSGNIGYASQHQIQPPQPTPPYWLGIPLATSKRTIGAMVLQRFDQERPFSLWSREVLLSIAGQVSIAIENARLHSETLRLYNLTDEALARRLKELQALLNSSQDGALMLDTRGKVALVNKMAASQLRSVPESLQGKRLNVEQMAGWLGYEPGEMQQILDEMHNGNPPRSSRKIYKSTQPQPGDTATLAVRYIDRNSVPVIGEESRVIGWLLALRDVTEERESAELRQDVTRMIVHDLRNPVSTLMSVLNRIEQIQPPANGAKQLMDNAKRGCLTILDMIDSLMDVHRMEAGQFIVEAEAMRLPPLIREAINHVQPLADERGIDLGVSIPEDLPAIWGDEPLLRRVTLNLLDNAFKFTPRGGQVKVALTTNGHDANLDAGIRCAISDSGPGIPPDKRNLIFDRYTRISQGGAQVRGTGLGLTFCKLALEAQGGEIWVEDSEEGGSRFIFTVPGIPDFEKEMATERAERIK